MFLQSRFNISENLICVAAYIFDLLIFMCKLQILPGHRLYELVLMRFTSWKNSCRHWNNVQVAKVLTVDYEKMSYLPAVFFNDFWLLRDYLIPMNSTVKETPIHFTISGLSGLKYMLYTQAETSFTMQVFLLSESMVSFYHFCVLCFNRFCVWNSGIKTDIYFLYLGSHVDEVASFLSDRAWSKIQRGNGRSNFAFSHQDWVSAHESRVWSTTIEWFNLSLQCIGTFSIGHCCRWCYISGFILL